MSDRREAAPDDGEAEDEGGGLAGAVDALGFFLRAPRRRPGLAAAVLAAGASLTAIAALATPRVYTAETRILGQRNVVMPLLSNPRRAVPVDWDTPTRAASEIVVRRENLVSLIEETGLLDRWEQGRPPLLRHVGALRQRLLGAPSTSERMRALAGILEKKLSVQTEDATIKITVAWHEPRGAFDIVSCAQKHFLEDRRAAETAAITEVIAIIEREAARQRETIARARAAVGPRARAAVEGESAPVAVNAGVRADAGSGARVRDRERLLLDLEEERKAIQALEEAHRRRLADLRAQLADLQLTYASEHPAVLALEEKIRQAEREPPELAERRRSEADLAARAGDLPARRAPVRAAAPAVAPPPRALLREEDPQAMAALAELTAAQQKYEDSMARLDAARIELETAQAAFKYRYVVLVPPELPEKPSKPSVVLVIVAGSALTIALAFAVTGARDLAGGRLLEAWQARRLRLPMLAEVQLPAVPAEPSPGDRS
ncbi:MAG: hypothetical protein QM820_24760 [Minicystis sp.]